MNLYELVTLYISLTFLILVHLFALDKRECQALYDFDNSTNGKKWHNVANWNYVIDSDSHMNCTMICNNGTQQHTPYGLACDPYSSHIGMINFTGNNLDELFLKHWDNYPV